MRFGKTNIEVVVSTPFEENCYVAYMEGKQECLVVDPGMEPERIIGHLENHQLQPVGILVTHGHADHIAGIGPIKQRWPEAVIVAGKVDARKLTDPVENLSLPFGLRITAPPAEVLLEEGDTYSGAGFEFQVLRIDGHATGHLVYLWNGHSPSVAFVGDVIFARSIGRTDFPGGSFEELSQGIHAKLFTLPDQTVLLSGHGPATTVGEEKRSNPFVGLGK